MIELNYVFIGIIICVIIFFIFILLTNSKVNKSENQNNTIQNPIVNVPSVSSQAASIQPNVVVKKSVTYEKSMNNTVNNEKEEKKVVTNSVESIKNIMSSQSIPTIIFD